MVDKSTKPFANITEVNVVEQLADIPWSAQRAKQHVVSEVAQALHKVLLFNNALTSPFQKWSQGRWSANWTVNTLGEHTYTLYVCIAVLEAKVKIRKERDFGWKKILGEIKELLTTIPLDLIHESTTHENQWQEMAGHRELTFKQTQILETTSPNRFAVLSDEEAFSS